MVEKFKQDKFTFEICWMFMLLIVAILKFYIEIYDSNEKMDYFIMIYTTCVYVIPILINARFFFEYL